jgi:hypothetical protein
MRTYRIVTREGVELANVQAASVMEVIGMPPAAAAPLGAKIVSAEGSRELARRELWTGGCPGWSLITMPAT